ncbi:MAG: hypothetical protein IPN59_03935 [Holophaga sp.]|nr:hypothetical protein [Holophaga sp.]
MGELNRVGAIPINLKNFLDQGRELSNEYHAGGGHALLACQASNQIIRQGMCNAPQGRIFATVFLAEDGLG